MQVTLVFKIENKKAFLTTGKMTKAGKYTPTPTKKNQSDTKNYVFL